MKKVLFLVLLGLNSCSSLSQSTDTTKFIQKKTATMNWQFKPLYDRFISAADKRHIKLDKFRVDNLQVIFADLTHNGKDLKNRKPTIIGLCTIFNENPDGTYSFQLEVDSFFWSSANVWYQESLLFHELGHCVLKQNHRDNSIMSPIIVTDTILKRKEDELLDELFNHKGV